MDGTTNCCENFWFEIDLGKTSQPCCKRTEHLKNFEDDLSYSFLAVKRPLSVILQFFTHKDHIRISRFSLLQNFLLNSVVLNGKLKFHSVFIDHLSLKG